MNCYKKICNSLLLYSFIFIGASLYILDILDLFKGGRYLALIVFLLVSYDVIKFYSSSTFRILFKDANTIILHRYKLFKCEELTLSISNLKYKYKKRISYPNEYYELFLINKHDDILINSSGGILFSFTESDEKEIIMKFNKFNIKRIE